MPDLTDVRQPSTVRFAGTGVRRVFGLGHALRKTYQDVELSYVQMHGHHIGQLTSVNAEAAKRIKPPSTFRYSAFIGISIAVDVFISPLVTAAWATFVLGVLAAIAVALCMAIIGRVFLGSHGKRASKHRKELQERSKELERDIQVVQQNYRSFLRWLGTVAKRFPQVAARASTLTSRVGRVAGKYKLIRFAGWVVNWLKKGWVKQTSEAVPLWNIFPWWTIGAVAAYLSHRGDWREAQDILARYNTGKQDVLNMTDAMYQINLAAISVIADDEAAISQTAISVPPLEQELIPRAMQDVAAPA